ncbi:T9SS type B sorting domain-containing protein [Spirosoma pollinicola]|uniref:Gliding motility-associated C-terminal domain-containing protein n=1 Tax=Spirosoma pollinicola TaxID=2057025 RepID=A0A2K8Z1Z6_9BACT|nr:gliding motility-associated C-terminal domain-containing protein [Spirosoma pollinicola]AUD03907.1 hypothetical protein CWM47_20015 [Spirosoma pollinicola]
MLAKFNKLIRNSHEWLPTLRWVIALITYSVYSFFQSASAQSCANPSGPLLIDQSFGTVSKPVSLSGLTTYQYVLPMCPADGQYTVTEAIDSGCFSNTWYAVASDHTPGDEAGNMMIVNGANTPGAFYEQSVAGFCGGTTYEISFWAFNLLKTGICPTPIIPNLAVFIETKSGQLVSSTNIGQVDLAYAPTWQQYSALFTVPKITEELVIKLVNTKGDYGCGNDMVIDDIQVRQCEACASNEIYVPDIFTPNNDGHNDELAFFLPRVTSFNLTVFDRWGSELFTSNTLNQKWDGSYAGSPCISGTYSWVITYQPELAGQKPPKHIQTGRVLLLR